MISTLVPAPVIPTIQVFNELPTNSFTGMVPAYIKHIGKMEDEKIAACYKLLNSVSLKSESLKELTKAGRLACVSYDKGVVKSICVHNIWVESFAEVGASRVILSSGGDEYALLDKDIGIETMTTDAYDKMARICLPIILKATTI